MTSINVYFPGRIEAAFSLHTDVRVVGISGPSGAGKSSLLRAIAGAEKNATANCSWATFMGEITETEVNVGQQPKIGMVFQQPMLFPHVDVMGNFRLAQRHQGGKALSVDKAAAGCCCEHLLGKSVASLSGGEAQRVAIARALINGADVLLLDESLSAVDVVTRRKIYQFLKQQCEAMQITCVFVSHDLEDLALFSDALVYIDDGKLKYAGSSSEVLDKIFNTGRVENPSAVLCGTLFNDVNEDETPTVMPMATALDESSSIKVICIGSQTVYASSNAAIFHDFADAKVKLAEHSIVKEVSVAIKASDVSLDTNVSMVKEANTSSMLNALLCSISHIAPFSSNKGAKVLITLNVHNSHNQLSEPAQTLYASISELSVTRLMLKVGMPVLARFKLL